MLEGDMRAHQINPMCGVVLIGLPMIALVTVVTGLIWPPPVPEPDEGTQAHLFQVSVAGLLPVTVVVVGTADWRRPWRSVLPLAIALLATVLAFAGLYYLEHFR